MELGTSHTLQVPLSPMSQAASSLGTCPLCGAAVPQHAVLIEYEANGEGRLYAECPRCIEPVQPQ